MRRTRSRKTREWLQIHSHGDLSTTILRVLLDDDCGRDSLPANELEKGRDEEEGGGGWVSKVQCCDTPVCIMISHASHCLQNVVLMK